MGRQDFDGNIQWIVVADEDPGELLDHRISLIRRTGPTPRPTLGANLLAAIPQIRSEFVVIIEDDDWYASNHLSTMMLRLQNSEMTGCCETRHYNVAHSGWCQLRRRGFACLFQTGMRKRVAEVLLKTVARKRRRIDWRLWKLARDKGLRLDLFDVPITAVGIKGLPGRPGAGRLHDKLDNKKYDPDRIMLREWVGSEAEVYAEYMTDEKKPTRR